jgi:hypothetical protein
VTAAGIVNHDIKAASLPQPFLEPVANRSRIAEVERNCMQVVKRWDAPGVARCSPDMMPARE